MIIAIGSLELLALLLALLGMWMGLHTDEAKYLLSIPYPHPPAIRWVLSLGLSLPFHEFLMRFVLASVIVQSSWLLWDLGAVLPRERQTALMLTWLLSTALILQGGTVMLAPMTAVFGLVFTCIALHPKGTSHCRGPCIGLLWILSLFSTYQCLLFAPLVWSSLKNNRPGMRESLAYFCIPIMLLVLYSLAHPLSIVSMMKVSTQDAPIALALRFHSWMTIIVIAGGGLTSVIGLWGILTGGRRDLLLTLLLIIAFIFLSSQQYYAILLLPLLAGGLFLLFCRRKVSPSIFIPLQIVASILVLTLWPPMHGENVARETLDFLQSHNIVGTIVIDGPYGHEWQYESRQPIRTFSDGLRTKIEEDASVFICTKKSCEDDIDADQWKPLSDMPGAWIRK